MGLISINDKFRINVEGKNYELQRYTGKKMKTNEVTQLKEESEEDNWAGEGYYGNIEHVFDKLIKLIINEKINKKLIVNLKELREIVNETKEEVIKLVKF